MPFDEITELRRLLKVARNHLKSAVDILTDDADEKDISDEIELIQEIDTFLAEK